MIVPCGMTLAPCPLAVQYVISICSVSPMVPPGVGGAQRQKSCGEEGGAGEGQRHRTRLERSMPKRNEFRRTVTLLMWAVWHLRTRSREGGGRGERVSRSAGLSDWVARAHMDDGLSVVPQSLYCERRYASESAHAGGGALEGAVEGGEGAHARLARLARVREVAAAMRSQQSQFVP